MSKSPLNSCAQPMAIQPLALPNSSSDRYGSRVVRRALWAALYISGFSALSVLSACSPPAPIPVGFLGGLSGKFADLGIATRNGALLAIEQANAAGGINGRPLVLLEHDDKQSADAAVQAMRALQSQGVVAIVGPATSSIAMAVTPLANASNLLMVTPTATTNKLTGLDDHFLRATGDAAFYGRAAARLHINKQGAKRVALILDMANPDYTESWGENYAAEFASLGGVVTTINRFTSTQEPNHGEIATQLLKGRPDLVVTVASSVDSALIAQRVRANHPDVRLAGSGWASTERLIELGGAGVEGMLFEQYFDRFDQSEKFQSFLKTYRERFKAEPGFGAVLAFDAANMIVAGLKASDGKDLKAAILKIGRFEGAQNAVTLNATGDANREVYFGVVQNGAFAPLK